MSNPGPLVVVPAYNEECTVGEVVDQAVVQGYPVCVVDDGSRDRTAEVAERAGATVLRLPMNLGVGGALRCGFRHAVVSGHSVVVQVDGDGQHDPAEMPGLLARMWETDADMVIGSRFLASDHDYPTTTVRRLVMGLLARRASAVVGSPITDATSGFRAIRSPLLEFFARDYPVEYLGDTFEALLSAGRRGARVVEHPISATIRQHGSPSAGPVTSVWYVLRVLAAATLVESRTSPRPLDRSARDRELTRQGG